MLEHIYAIAREVSSEGNAKFKRIPHGLSIAKQRAHLENPTVTGEVTVGWLQ